MRNFLIRQAVFVFFIYFGTLIVAGLFAEDYSHAGQHASELALNSNAVAVGVFTAGIFLTGLSMILFGIGIILKFRGALPVTSFLVILFGITFLFGAFFKIGSPWHGLYGVGLSVMMLPFAFLYETGKERTGQLTRFIAIASALIIFVYFWAMIARLDPVEYRGLTQRIFGIFVFAFVSWTALVLNKPEHWKG